eukprot:gene30250-35237_t
MRLRRRRGRWDKGEQREAPAYAKKKAAYAKKKSAYARKKAEVIAERERREAEKRAMKEADQKRLADRLETNFKSKMDIEDKRLARDLLVAEQKSLAAEVARQAYLKETIAGMDVFKNAEQKSLADKAAKQAFLKETIAGMDAEQKSLADEAARQAFLKDTIAGMDVFNKQQLKQKQTAKTKQMEEEKEVMKEWTIRTQQLKAEVEEEKSEWTIRTQQLKAEEQTEFAEQAEVAEVKHRNRGVADFQLRQAQIRARKAAQAKIDELQDAAQIQLTIREQEDIFQQYAAICIAEYEAQGKPTVPMHIHLNRKETIDKMR